MGWLWPGIPDGGIVRPLRALPAVNTGLNLPFQAVISLSPWAVNKLKLSFNGKINM